MYALSDSAGSLTHLYWAHQDDLSLFRHRFNLLREYLYWCLRSSFLAVLMTETCLFLTWTWLFAAAYYILVQFNPECITGPGGLNFEESNMGFIDAFTLSWTTFSTTVSHCFC